MTILLVLCSALPLLGQTRAEAEKLLSEGRYQKAVTAFESLLTREGRKAPLLMGLGQSLFGLKEGKRSQALFQEVAGMEASHAEARFWTGRVLEMQGLDGLESGKALARADLRDAVAFYREAASLRADYFEARFAAGRTLMYLLDFDAAVTELREAEKIRPDDKTVRAHLLGALYRGQRYAPFLELARMSGDIDPLREFEAVLRLERYEEAEKLLLALIDTHGFAGRVEPYNVLSAAFTSLSKPKRHIALLTRLIEVRPDEAYALYYLGYAEALVGSYEAAADHFRRYLEVDASSWTTRRHLASVLRLLGRLDESRTVVLKAFAQAPEAKVVQEEIGSLVGAYVDRRTFKAALDLHQRLLRIDPGAQTRRDHAILLKEMGRLEDAATMLKGVCEEESVEGFRLSGFWNDYGLSLKGLGRLEEARKAFQTAVKVFAYNADAHENLGVLSIEQGRLEEARAHLEEAIRSRGSDKGERDLENARARYYLRLIKNG